MREILFRAKDIDTDAFPEWIYGYAVFDAYTSEWAIFNENDGETFGCTVNPDTLCQYTGVTDKNGNKIFEGDIVLKRTYNGKKPIPVTFHDGMFHCGWGGGSSTATHAYTLNDKQIEVIGNIYDNPELLKGEK